MSLHQNFYFYTGGRCFTIDTKNSFQRYGSILYPSFQFIISSFLYGVQSRHLVRMFGRSPLVSGMLNETNINNINEGRLHSYSYRGFIKHCLSHLFVTSSSDHL